MEMMQSELSEHLLRLWADEVIIEHVFQACDKVQADDRSKQNSKVWIWGTMLHISTIHPFFLTNADLTHQNLPKIPPTSNNVDMSPASFASKCAGKKS